MMEGTNEENSFLPQFDVLPSTENSMKNSTRLLGLLLLALLFLASLPALAYNMADDGTHSVRPTLTPALPTATPVAHEQQTAVAAIVLISDGDVGGLETAVQWQGEYRNWHTVEGWQAPFNEYKQVTWAVAAADYGKGPFRWVIYENDVAIENSSDFYLPNSGDDVVITHVMP